MIIAIRVVLAIGALWYLQSVAWAFCTNWLFPPFRWNVSDVVVYIAGTIGIPLAIAFIAWYFSKSKAIFWNTLVGGLVVMAGFVFYIVLTQY